AVSLPETKKIELRFFRAMRDVFAPEPPTDGVIFRVYASLLGEATEVLFLIFFEKLYFLKL
ncbi:MAG: hypothetical protein II037_07575, partial [Bacteroidales bacterium]|nr:hypothetical protein [Bacteroidales bacterium]